MPSENRHLTPLVVSVVLHRSDLSQFRSLLESLSRAAVVAELHQLPVICVDHSLHQAYSADAQSLCEQLNEEQRLQIHYIRRDINPGYGAGHNHAFEAASGRYQLILNPDVELSEQALKRALRTMDDDDTIGLLAPVGFGVEGQPQYLAKGFPSVAVLGLRAFAPAWLRRLFEPSLSRYELQDQPAKADLRNITLASGCCMWVRRDLLDQVRGFNEDFFLYFEDYDLSLRIADLASVVEHHQISIVHHGGAAAQKGLRHQLWFIAGAVRFFNRWGWRWFG